VLKKNKGSTKYKGLHRKNIADGKIKLNITSDDRVPEDYMIEYRDNPFEILDQHPECTSSYVENIRGRNFT